MSGSTITINSSVFKQNNQNYHDTDREGGGVLYIEFRK